MRKWYVPDNELINTFGGRGYSKHPYYAAFLVFFSQNIKTMADTFLILFSFFL